MPREMRACPYFPPSNRVEFGNAHKVFGATAIIKTLQDLPMEDRAVAVGNMVYAATARLNDPVQGCAGMVFQLQKQVSDLQAQLAIAQAELVKMQSERVNREAFISRFRTSITAADSSSTVDGNFNQFNHLLI